MTPATKNSTPRSNWLDNALLCILLGLTVLRSSFIENPHIDQSQAWLFFNSETISLLLSTVILACIGIWLLVSFLRHQFSWRKSGFGIAVMVFIAAGILAACFASNKRAAITDLTTLAAPMLAGVLLVQLLTSYRKIRQALLLILAVGIAASVLCFLQWSFFNDETIKNYEENPAAFLTQQNIEPGTLEHWMYEHRLYSKDIHGFLMTSNSAASFFLLTIFASVGLCITALAECRKRKTWKDRERSLVMLICYALGLAAVLAGLILTRSKGGIGSFALGLILLIALGLFGRIIFRHRRIVGVLALLGIVVAAGFIVHYGTQHGRLPGGNSMLVRWQYWVNAADMIRDHALTGIGGGNFPEFYTHYKTPAASETVQNPHNWLLSLLSQYGPLGLIAFLAAICLPLYRAAGRAFTKNTPLEAPAAPQPSRLWIGLLTVSAAMLLLVRPALVDPEFLRYNPTERIAAYVILYALPAAAFIVAFVLLRFASPEDAHTADHRHAPLSIALVCGIIAVLIHNLIDFAIFEPGNWSVLWLFIAILAAQIHNAAPAPEKTIAFDAPKRMGLFAGLILVSIVYLSVALAPPLKAQSIFSDLYRSTNFLQTRQRMNAAIAADTLSPADAYKAAMLLTNIYQKSPSIADTQLLDTATDYARIAADRNPADFKPWRLLGKIHVMQSEQTAGKQKQQHREAAFEALQQALRRYPGSGKLHYLLGRVAEQLEQPDVALTHYREAVAIEDAYRAQFRIMYPDQETVISRLGNNTYAEAKEKIAALQDNQ